VALDVAFRVIADHIRTLSFAICRPASPPATPTATNVLRRILRRAVRLRAHPRLPRTLLLQTRRRPRPDDGRHLPELRARQPHVEEVLRREEEAFNGRWIKGSSYLKQWRFGTQYPLPLTLKV